MPITSQQILDALRVVQDPDLHRNIVELGFVKNIVVDGGTGAIQFSNEADGDQVAFPANFPGVEAGSTIIIDGLFSAGTFS